VRRIMSIRVLMVLGVGVVGAALGGSEAWGTPRCELLLPAETVGFAAVADAKDLAEHWKKTGVGRLMEDESLKPFGEDLRQQLEERWSGLREKLGLTIKDLQGVVGGELAVALVYLDDLGEDRPPEAAMVALIDVTDHVPAAEALLEKVAASFERNGAKRSLHQIGDISVTEFRLPERPEDERPRRVYYFLQDTLLGVTDNLDVVRDILARTGEETEGTLASSAEYQAVMARCVGHSTTYTPQIRWFIQPLGYLQAVRAATPKKLRRKGKSRVAIFTSLGFDALQGVGGTVDFNVDQCEVVYRVAFQAPGPLAGSMKLIGLEEPPAGNNADPFAPPAWVPRGIASYSTLYWNALQTFDNLGPFADEIFFDEDEGEDVWEQLLESLKDDPHGPRIDLRDDLVRHFGPRVIVVTQCEQPVTVNSQRLLLAVATRDEASQKKLAEGIKRTLQNDDNVILRRIEDYEIWEIVDVEEESEAPVVGLPSVESLNAKDGGDKPAPDKPAVALPHWAITVAHGHFFISSHLEYLLKVLKEFDKGATLQKTTDYKDVQAALKRLAPELKGVCSRTFLRTDETFRQTYEMIRQGKMPESETTLAQALNLIFPSEEEGKPRQQKIDGSKLPDFEIVRRYLGPSGRVITRGDDGWFILGFTLPKGE